jgi:phosphoenolpyruvate synthase/pyruvate phosphate dikinase
MSLAKMIQSKIGCRSLFYHLRRLQRDATRRALVSVTATPARTPLFTMASAVVTDIGGPLSHSSIVAHEYGDDALNRFENFPDPKEYK